MTNNNFKKEVAEAKEVVLVDFWAPWCGPCRAIAPIVEQIAEEWEGKGVKVGKLNVDEEPAIAGQFGVLSIPTLIFFKGGKVAGTLVGSQTKDKINDQLTKIIS